MDFVLVTYLHLRTTLTPELISCTIRCYSVSLEHHFSSFLSPCAILEQMILENGEYDLSKLFALIAELGESLNENRSLAVSSYTQATNVKVNTMKVVPGKFVHPRSVRRKRFIVKLDSSFAGRYL